MGSRVLTNTATGTCGALCLVQFTSNIVPFLSSKGIVSHVNIMSILIIIYIVFIDILFCFVQTYVYKRWEPRNTTRNIVEYQQLKAQHYPRQTYNRVQQPRLGRWGKGAKHKCRPKLGLPLPEIERRNCQRSLKTSQGGSNENQPL